MATTLELVLLFLVAAVAGAVICRLARLPPMLGYLAVGVLIGPNAMALAKDSAAVNYLAEFGVVFLMFVIGLEFNLPKLRSMRKLVFGLGLSQVGLTMLAALAGNLLIGVGLRAVGTLLEPRLAERGCARRRARDEQHRDRRQADGRAARARDRARPPRDGRAAVPGLGGGAAAGADPGARLVARGAAERARAGGVEGRRRC
jgi:hypothetical protein